MWFWVIQTYILGGEWITTDETSVKAGIFLHVVSVNGRSAGPADSTESAAGLTTRSNCPGCPALSS